MHFNSHDNVPYNLLHLMHEGKSLSHIHNNNYLNFFDVEFILPSYMHFDPDVFDVLLFSITTRYDRMILSDFNG